MTRSSSSSSSRCCSCRCWPRCLRTPAEGGCWGSSGRRRPLCRQRPRCARADGSLLQLVIRAPQGWHTVKTASPLVSAGAHGAHQPALHRDVPGPCWTGQRQRQAGGGWLRAGRGARAGRGGAAGRGDGGGSAGRARVRQAAPARQRATVMMLMLWRMCNQLRPCPPARARVGGPSSRSGGPATSRAAELRERAHAHALVPSPGQRSSSSGGSALRTMNVLASLLGVPRPSGGGPPPPAPEHATAEGAEDAAAVAAAAVEPVAAEAAGGEPTEAPATKRPRRGKPAEELRVATGTEEPKGSGAGAGAGEACTLGCGQARLGQVGPTPPPCPGWPCPQQRRPRQRAPTRPRRRRGPAAARTWPRWTASTSTQPCSSGPCSRRNSPSPRPARRCTSPSTWRTCPRLG